MPTPTPALLLVTDPSPWAWSLSTLVALLGALATVTVAGLALVQTRRANRLEAEARVRAEGARERETASRERARRAELIPAVTLYVDVWMPRGKLPEPGTHGDVHLALDSVASSISDAATDVASWVIEAVDKANVLVNLYRRVNPFDLDPVPPHSELIRGAAWSIKARVIQWASTGELDRSPVTSYLVEDEATLTNPSHKTT